MPKVAIFVLAGPDTEADLGRVVNALQAAGEFRDAGDEFRVILDGAGTQWVGVLSDEDHPYHELYRELADVVEVCEYCADAYDAQSEVESSSPSLVSEHEGHPSVRDAVADGFEVVTY